uniref:Uncharacterized protein n=1 Tax=Rhizophora mucronata TaxID=61149 RepID=A0A2P2NMH7_RHIMU
MYRAETMTYWGDKFLFWQWSFSFIFLAYPSPIIDPIML